MVEVLKDVDVMFYHQSWGSEMKEAEETLKTKRQKDIVNDLPPVRGSATVITSHQVAVIPLSPTRWHQCSISSRKANIQQRNCCMSCYVHFIVSGGKFPF